MNYAVFQGPDNIFKQFLKSHIIIICIFAIKNHERNKLHNLNIYHNDNRFVVGKSFVK